MFGKVTVFVNGVLLGALDIIYSDYTGSEVMPLSLSLWSCTVSSKLYLIPTKLATPPLIGMSLALTEYLVQDENILYLYTKHKINNFRHLRSVEWLGAASQRQRAGVIN